MKTEIDNRFFWIALTSYITFAILIACWLPTSVRETTNDLIKTGISTNEQRYRHALDTLLNIFDLIQSTQNGTDALIPQAPSYLLFLYRMYCLLFLEDLAEISLFTKIRAFFKQRALYPHLPPLERFSNRKELTELSVTEPETYLLVLRAILQKERILHAKAVKNNSYY